MPNIEKIRVGETEYNITDSINIAPVEMSSTSANAYAVGDMLIYNGQLYEVISAIAVGNTLTVGTNIQASKVSAKIKEIDSNLTVTSGSVTWNTGNVSGDPTRKTWYKMGKLVIVSLEWTPLSGKIANNYVICSGLPIPNVSGMYMNGGNTQQVRVSGDGELMYHFPTDTTTLDRIDMTVVYFTN